MNHINSSCSRVFYFTLFFIPVFHLSAQQAPDVEIPLTEDLMREHGVLNRILLIYENVIQRINKHQEVPTRALSDAVSIIKTFIEDYHEKLEEDYLFPLAEKNEPLLIKTLKQQHAAGRKITTRLQNILAQHKTPSKKTKLQIKSLLQKFITMYRPHEAREDTILFPQIRSYISAQEFDELGEKFEDLEHQLFGEHGFEDIVKKVEVIEKELGIYDLELFTPHT